MDFCAGKVRQACGLWELQPAQRAVLVLRGAGDILTEPAWRPEGIGSRFIRKFDLGKDHAVQITGEKVQLDVQAAVQGDDIAVLGDQMSVRFSIRWVYASRVSGRLYSSRIKRPFDL